MAVAKTRNPRTGATPNFDSLARLYRWMEYFSFGLILERCRFYFLADCAHARRALVLGDGDGRFTARLLAANRIVQVDAVDSSAAMLRELERRAAQAVDDAGIRLRTIQADLRSFTPDRGDYDLIVSHFFLDCLIYGELEEMVARIVPHLAPEAIWLNSEFSIPEQGWRRIIARSLIRSLYFAFDKMTHLHVQQIPDYPQALERIGFRRQCQAQFPGGLLVAEIWMRQASMHSTGDFVTVPRSHA